MLSHKNKHVTFSDLREGKIMAIGLRDIKARKENYAQHSKPVKYQGKKKSCNERLANWKDSLWSNSIIGSSVVHEFRNQAAESLKEPEY